MSLRHGAYAAMLLFVLAGCLPLHRVYRPVGPAPAPAAAAGGRCRSPSSSPRGTSPPRRPGTGTSTPPRRWPCASPACRWRSTPSSSSSRWPGSSPTRPWASPGSATAAAPAARLVTYTAAAVLGVVVAVLVDLVVLRTRLLATSRWWMAYAIVVFFQLLTNGWLTGRGHRPLRLRRHPRLLADHVPRRRPPGLGAGRGPALRVRAGAAVLRRLGAGRHPAAPLRAAADRYGALSPWRG